MAARRLLKDTCEIAAEILAGKYDGELDYIHHAVQARKKDMFRPGTKWTLTGTKDITLDGKVVTIIRVNQKSIAVGVGEKDAFGYEREYNVPPVMLAPISAEVTA